MGETQIKYSKPTELNLVDFFWSVLRHWRAILAILLAAGILLGGFELVKKYREYNDEELAASRKASYEASLEVYQADRSRLEKQIENLKSSLARQQKMQENAVILQIDPYNVYTRNASYYIDTNYRIAPELFFQNPNYTTVITNSYLAAIDRIDYDAIIASDANPSLTTVNPVSGSEKKLVATSTDTNNGLLNITVFGDSQETVDKLMTAIQETLTEMSVTLNRAIGRHTLTLLTESNGTVTDSEFADVKTTFNTNFEEDSDALEKVNSKLEALVEPTDTVPSKRGILLAAIKSFLIGVVGAAVLILIVALILYFLRDRLHSTAEIRARYRTTVLGTLQGKRRRRFDRFVAKKLGISAKADEETYAFIAANAKLRLAEAKEILLIGSVEEEKLGEIRDGLAPLFDDDVSVTAGGNVNANADAVESLFGDCAVICVERIASTAHESIRREAESLSAAKKEVLGFVICG